jgi:hypothetical protein
MVGSQKSYEGLKKRRKKRRKEGVIRLNTKMRVQFGLKGK